MIHDYPERDEPQSSLEQGPTSSTVHLATDDFCKNDSDNVTLVRIIHIK